jgi:metal-responsive CopG/Arc/MetJ family transcriptional regulator
MAHARHQKSPKRKRVRYNISIPSDLADGLNKFIEEGRYDGPSEFMRVKLREELGLNRMLGGS